MECVEPIRNREEIETVKRILKGKGMRNFLLFLIGINSGLRISDILKLKVQDVIYFCVLKYLFTVEYETPTSSAI